MDTFLPRKRSSVAAQSPHWILLLHRPDPERVTLYRSLGATVVVIEDFADFPRLATELAHGLFPGHTRRNKSMELIRIAFGPADKWEPERGMRNQDDHDYEHRYIAANGIRLHVVLAGPTDGTPVILLHGFPEYWYAWRKQIPFLAARGFRVWVPDLRGYNISDKPEGIKAYRLPTLADDVAGLIQATGSPSVSLVGHDWGAAVAWQLAAQSPELVQRIVILNVPHPAVMMRALRRNPRQMLRSWYIAFFQLPWLPELLVRPMLARVLRRTSRPGTFSDADLALYRQAWAVPGAITAMLNWYRALRYASEPDGGSARIRVPTLLIWGAKDHALGREMAQPSIELCDHGRLEFIESATHWVQHEEPERVNELLDSFLRQAEGAAMGSV